MKKIMYNDRLGLTDLALNGKKTLTSRLETGLQDAISIEQISTGSYQVTDMNGNKHLFKPRLKPGEYIAIAMNYEQIWKQSNDPDRFLQIIANKHQVEKIKSCYYLDGKIKCLSRQNSCLINKESCLSKSKGLKT